MVTMTSKIQKCFLYLRLRKTESDRLTGTFFLSFFFTQTSISRDWLEQGIIALSSHIWETNQSPAFVMNITVNNSESHFSLDSLKTEAAYFFYFGADFYSNERLRVRDPRFVNLSKRQHQ